MQPHEIHHIKAYIVFSILSVFFVGLLIYLYLPESVGNLSASVLDNKTGNTVQEVSPPQSVTSDISVPAGDTDNALSGRRMRLTQLLIRTQKELQILENKRKSSPEGLDAATEANIKKLREKITTIENIITDMK